MPDINVNFIHPTDGRAVSVTLEGNITASEAIIELIANKFIPPNPQGYNLAKKGGSQIRANESFAEAGIIDNATIRIIPATDAGCFSEETKITLSTGETIPIKDIRSGTSILVFDESLKVYRETIVEGIYRQTYSEYIEINNHLITSPDQVLWLFNGIPKTADEIVRGDLLLYFPFNKAEVISFKKIKQLMNMHSLVVPQQHCFIAEGYIAKDLIGKQAYNPRHVDVFLSYSEGDSEKARNIFELLNKREIPTFLSEKSIKPGDYWEREIRESLKNCKNFWILVTPNSLKSEWVISEWSAAWALEKLIVPILYRCTPNDLPKRLQVFQCIDYHEVENMINNYSK